MPEVVVELRGVSKHYFGPLGGFIAAALAAANFEIRRGEVFALIGPPAAGKSTVVKMIAGQEKPFMGKVKVFGRSPRRRDVRSRLIFAPQPKPGSSPMSPEAVLAYAEAKKTELVLLDEPFRGLNSTFANALQSLMRGQARAGRTFILTGQLLGEVQDICHRIALIYNGTVEAIGTLQELLSGPQALRLLAPVIPAATAEDLLRLLRDKLGASTSEIARPCTEAAKADTENPASSLEITPSVSDPINHNLLAELGRPPPGNTSSAQ